MQPLQCAPFSSIEWSYAYLIELRCQDGGFELVCGSEANVPEFTVSCPSTEADLLVPYAALHNDWREDPIGVEPPLVPYVRERTGLRTFSTGGARMDYGIAQVA